MEISTYLTSNSTNTSEKKEKKEDTQNSFDVLLMQTKEKTDESEESNESVEAKRTLEELVADIFSLMKTGMTVSERERLQELLRELKKEIEEGNYSESEVEEMLKNIEKEITFLQKSISGQAIKEFDESTSSEDSLNGDITTEFLDRIEEAMDTLNDIAKGKEKNKFTGKNPNDSQLLEMIKKFQS